MRYLLLTLLMFTAPLSWGETWRCNTEWVRDGGRTITMTGQTVPVIFYLDGPDPVVEFRYGQPFTAGIEITRVSDSMVMGTVKPTRGFYPDSTWRILKRRGKVQMSIPYGGPFAVGSTRVGETINIAGSCL